MPVHPPIPARVCVLPVLGLVVSALILSASDAIAQKQVAASSDYRLTMPVLRKAFGEVDRLGTESCTEAKRSLRELAELTVEQAQERIETCAPMRQAAAARGISTRELAQISTALFQASWRMTQEAQAEVAGGSLPPLPPGVLRDNIAFLRDNQAELATLGEPQP